MLYVRGTNPGRNVARLDGSLGTRHARILGSTVPFTQLPDSLFHSQRKWTVLGFGRWRFGDHIVLGEGRAAFKLSAALAAHAGHRRLQTSTLLASNVLLTRSKAS